MALIVQKYGGSSLASAEYIKKVAAHIGKLKSEDNDVVVVVSAMGKTTDELLQLANEVCADPDKRELDMLLSVGERISISLLALALQDLGYRAKSFTGSQVGIITDNHHTRARILEIRADRLIHELQQGKIVIIAGFQGVSLDKEITTLGRGGSDTTAVAIGAALKADRVELMKDVDGVLKADPGIVDSPEIVSQITYREMEEMASLDAGVVKSESVELAKYYGIKVGIGSSLSGNIGTIVCDEPFAPDQIKAITLEKDLIFVEIDSNDAQQTATILSANYIKLKNFRQQDEITTFDIHRNHFEEFKSFWNKATREKIKTEENFAVISFVGNGIKPGTKATAIIFQMLKKMNIKYRRSIVTENRISISVPEKEAESMIREFYDWLYEQPVKITPNEATKNA